MRRLVVTTAAVALASLQLPVDARAQRVQQADPVWAPPLSNHSGCPAPTLALCSDGEWLYSDDPCAIEQNAPDSECAALLYGDLDERADDGDEQLFIVPRSLDAKGVAPVIRTPAAQIQAQREYVPDVFSVTSRKAGADYANITDIGINQFADWDANGNVVTSCREYAYERFYDINEYQRRVGPFRDEYGRAFEEAYKHPSNDWAIGSRHLADARLRGKDGKEIGYIFRDVPVAKNELFRIPNHPEAGAEAGIGITGPGLLTSLAAFHQPTAARLAKIESHKQGGAHLVNKTWLWQKQMKDLLSYKPAAQPVFDPGQVLANQPNPPPNVGLQLDYAAGPQARKRLYEELDELYDLQQRLLELVERWGELDWRFPNSGWTVEGAGLEDDGFGVANLGELALPPAVFPLQPFPLAANVTPKVIGPVKLALDVQQVDIETLQRRAVLEELVEIIRRADNEGCLEDGATPCDWSPKSFVLKAMRDYSAQEDARYEWCQAFTGGNLANVLNLNLVVVAHPQFYCAITTQSTITAKGLEDLEDRVEECREAQIAYQQFQQQELAKARVREIPELVDPATGGFKPPGIDKSRDEYMGNKYFGLGYDYGFGFGMDIQSEICTINMHAGGHMNVYTKVFGEQLYLLDAAANADTDDRVVHVHAEIIGIELFQGIDETWSTQEDFHFDIVKKPNKKKSQKIIDTTIVVVVVPIGIELGISGEVGATLGLTLDTEGLGGDACPKVVVGGLVEPYLAVNGYVAAGIDIFIASAGIRGEVNIITVKLPFRPGIGLALIGDDDGDLLPESLALEVSASLDLRLQTLSGNIYAYAEVGFCPFCYTGEFTIVKWNGPAWNQTLFNQVYSVDLVDLDAVFNP